MENENKNVVVEIPQKKKESKKRIIGKIILRIFIFISLVILDLISIYSCKVQQEYRNIVVSDNTSIVVNRKKDTFNYDNVNNVLNVDNEVNIVNSYLLLPYSVGVEITQTEFNSFYSIVGDNIGFAYIIDNDKDISFSFRVHKISAYSYTITCTYISAVSSYNYILAYLVGAPNSPHYVQTYNTNYEYNGIFIPNFNGVLTYSPIPNLSYSDNLKDYFDTMFENCINNVSLGFYDSHDYDVSYITFNIDYSSYYQELENNNRILSEENESLINTNENLQEIVNGYNGMTFIQIFNEGKQEGMSSVQAGDLNNLFKTTAVMIFNSPYNILHNVFNFTFLGINLFSLFSFLITCSIVVYIIKLFKK